MASAKKASVLDAANAFVAAFNDPHGFKRAAKNMDTAALVSMKKLLKRTKDNDASCTSTKINK